MYQYPYLMVAMAENGGLPTGAVGSSRWWCGGFRRIGAAIRYAEAFAAIGLLSWSSIRLPDALRIAAIFLRRLSALILSTPFVFFLGNAIVLTLLARSRNLSSSSSSTSPPSLYDEFLKHASAAEIGSRGSDEEEVVYEDKAVCFEETKKKAAAARFYRRTKSEVAIVDEPSQNTFPGRELRRTVTVAATATATEATEEEEAEEEAGEEKVVMTNEELTERVEAFIAKQLKFRMAESVATVTAGDLTAD